MQVFRPITYLPVFILGLFLFSVNASCQADNPYRHLARAVELYNEGRYDESFDETTQQIELDEHCALAYYYRARIRVMRSDYRRAGLSIIAALRDSSGYTDAVGLHAYILRETGQHDDALNEWRRFIEDAGATGEEITLDSIMLPDEYYRQLERIRTAEREQSAPKPEESAEDTVETAMQPQPIVDYIENKESEENRQRGEADNMSSEQEILPFQNVIICGLIIVLAVLAGILIRKRIIRRRSAPLVDMVELSVDVVPEEKTDEEPEPVPDDVPFTMEYVPETPYEQAVKLKEERDRRTIEINLLMTKIDRRK